MNKFFMENILFVTLDEVVEIHRDQIERYGGRSGIRELSLLQSALAVPGASFEGVFLHTDLHTMAAAYVFHRGTGKTSAGEIEPFPKEGMRRHWS